MEFARARRVDWPADVSAVARSLAAGSGNWFWLDGAADPPAAADIIGADGTAAAGSAAGRPQVPPADPGTVDRRSYLGAAAEVLVAERGREREFLAALRGQNWVAALGYELGVAMLGADPAPDDVAPAFALRPVVVLELDHSTGEARLLGESGAAIDAWLDAHVAALGARHPAFDGCVRAEAGGADALHPDSAMSQISDPEPSESPSSVTSPNLATSPSRPTDTASRALRWRRDETRYRADVAACRVAIAEGDAYVLCLTDTAAAPLPPGADPLDLFLRLRASGPALRGGVIVAGGRALVSASPERFLEVRGGMVATHPIKGTRPRAADPVEDERLAAELAADPKERAENLMIVDLMRNDLSRVCLPGTVATRGFLRVERHPRVHQLVSTVIGRLVPGKDALDTVAVCFPGGSMTGAPKRRAVELLAAIEGAPRGLYAGCFGWLGAGGDAEFAMMIRGIELRGLGTGSAEARVGAGGGVTSDSDPAREQAEKLLKAAPLLAVLAAAAAEAAVPPAGGEVPPPYRSRG